MKERPNQSGDKPREQERASPTSVQERPSMDRDHRAAEDARKLAAVAEAVKTSAPPSKVRIKKDLIAYVEEHLPAHLRNPSKVAAFYTSHNQKKLAAWEAQGKVRVEGREHVPPAGACLIVANHTRMEDEVRVMGIADRPVRVVAADVHFTGLLGVKRAVVERLGFIEAHPTLGNLSTQEKEDLMNRLKPGDKPYYKAVIDRERDPKMLAKQKEFLRAVVAVLLKGEAVALFPEGLWLEEGNVMRKAYGGIELIAKEYERLTGETLPVVPVAITDDAIRVQRPTTMKEKPTVHDVMKGIAQLLPEKERGYYGESV